MGARVVTKKPGCGEDETCRRESAGRNAVVQTIRLVGTGCCTSRIRAAPSIHLGRCCRYLAGRKQDCSRLDPASPLRGASPLSMLPAISRRREGVACRDARPDGDAVLAPMCFPSASASRDLKMSTFEKPLEPLGMDAGTADGGDTCAHCQSPLLRPLKCSLCKSRVFCSKQCQVQDWSAGHKKCCPGKKKKQLLQAGEDQEELIIAEVSVANPRLKYMPLIPSSAAKDRDHFRATVDAIALSLPSEFCWTPTFHPPFLAAL
ncbi:MAG: zinc finger MYND domain-containing protein, partial [Promethearchaeia archaeon]